MSDNKFEKSLDRQAVPLDRKKRIIDLLGSEFIAPLVGVYDEPVRYYKLNLEWAKLFAGWLAWMETTTFWSEAEDENFTGIQGILEFEEGIELPPSFDCSDVEDCLSSSAIIAALNEEIDALNAQIEDLQEQIEEIENEAPTDGVVLPPNPDMPSGADTLCESATYVADRLTATLLDVWDKANTLTAFDFLQALLGVVWWDFTKAFQFWQFALSLALPTLGDDAASYEETIKNHLFCNELDLQKTIDSVIADLSIPANERELWRGVMENLLQSQIDEWAMLGSLLDTDADCSEGCPWVVTFAFGSDFVPVGDETLIVYGDSWTVVGGIYNNEEYSAIADVMTLSKALPEQCRLIQYSWSVAKGATCLATDQRYWWKGSDGEGAEEFSSFLRYLSDAYGQQNASVLGNPIMSQAKVSFDGFFCGTPAQYGQRCQWIRLVGTGAYPQE